MNDDVSHVAEVAEESGEQHPGSELARPADVLPGAIYLLPNPSRPFFPGQVMPVLLTNEQWLETLQAAQTAEQNVVGVVYTGDKDIGELSWEDFRAMGTACRIHQVQRHQDQIHVVLAGEQRFKVEDWISWRSPFQARVKYFRDDGQDDHQVDPVQIKAYTTAILNAIKELLPLNPLYGEELKIFLQNYRPGDPSRLADFAAALTTAEADELQEILETVDIESRLEKSFVLLKKELEVAKAQMEIRKHVEDEMQSRQREVFLREQLKYIQKELGIQKDDRTAEIELFKERIEALTLPEAAQKRVDEELQKMSVLEVGSPEYTVTRNYLDWLTVLPWGVHTEDNLDLDQAAHILDRDHEGLADVKERILEFLSLGKLRGEVAGSILLFVGPPGVGKTSLGRSIAEALNRRFYRFSLGGMRDEAEIKGHRRTYIGAMPGKFIQAIKETGSSNPVIVLDEIDKVGASFRGDPASALLEVLDPEQNSDFLDHYLDLRFDLSKVLFICTANQLDTIPAPLLDRMEVVQLSGYLASEKLDIARKHLLPKLLRRSGLRRGRVRIDRAAIRRIIEHYAREAGVRKLEKMLAKVLRKAALRIVRGQADKVRVRAGDIQGYLGKAVFEKERRMSGVGVTTGLAWTPLGGVTLAVEANRVHSQSRGFKLTGQLGDVMKESAEIAYSYIAGNARKFGADPGYFDESFVHLHVPAGATPKDGPSAGITMATALLSLARRRRVKNGIAMTGELTLTGQVLPVGGIQEKILAARRAGIREVILPGANKGTYEELPEPVTRGMTVHFADKYADVFEIVFA
ncbi:MAG: endopeptidase La [Arenicellales bacterium]